MTRGLCSRGCFSSAVEHGGLWSSLGFVVPSVPHRVPWDRDSRAETLLEEAHVPPRSQMLWDAPAAWPQHVGMHMLGKKVPGNFLGISQGELQSGNFLPSPFVPSFLTHTLLLGSQTALKKATAHTMLFPSPAGAGDKILHPAGDTELALCLGKALPGPASWSHTKGLPQPRAKEKYSGPYRCILPQACSVELCKKSVPLP